VLESCCGESSMAFNGKFWNFWPNFIHLKNSLLSRLLLFNFLARLCAFNSFLCSFVLSWPFFVRGEILTIFLQPVENFSLSQRRVCVLCQHTPTQHMIPHFHHRNREYFPTVLLLILNFFL
jgi:hypothetical protein